MSLDNLLFWLSAKTSGSWSQFRAAVEGLHVERGERSQGDLDGNERAASDLPVYQELRLTLQRLGHVEFKGAEHAWRVVPPSLALLPGEDGAAVLCGARSLDLLDALKRFQVDPLVAEGMPQRVLIRAESKTAIALIARDSRLYIEESPAIRILCATPRTRDAANWIQTELPETAGWTVHQFSPSKREWISVSQERAIRTKRGLFRFVMDFQRFYFLRFRGVSYKVLVQIGKYSVMSKRDAALRYDAPRMIFSCPLTCRPPLLIERALVLCSGLLPRIASGRLEYGNVPPDVARLAAEVLH